MGIFRRKSSGLFVPARELLTHERTPRMQVPFVFDGDGKPAFQPTVSFSKSNVSLMKRFDAAQGALEKFDLKGLRMNVIVLLDGSGSMASDYSNGTVQKLLERTLGFAMQVDKDGVEVIVYNSKAHKPFRVDVNNYQTASRSVPQAGGATNMASAFKMARQMAAKSDKLTFIINISDGNPATFDLGATDNKTLTTNEVFDLSELPALVKNLAIRPVKYFEELDDAPSRVEYQKDENEKALRDGDGNLLMYRNDASTGGNGIRAFDNVDSQVVDPYNDSDEVFAVKMTTELSEGIEVLFRMDMLTGTAYPTDFKLTA